jgi:hypothetical protein
MPIASAFAMQKLTKPWVDMIHMYKLLQVDLVRPKTNLLYKTDELIDIVEHAKERLAAKKAVKKRLKAQKRRAKRTAAAAAAAAASATNSTITSTIGRRGARSVSGTDSTTATAAGAADDDDEPVYITVMNYETGQTERTPIDMSEYVSDADDSDYSYSDSSDSDSDTDTDTDTDSDSDATDAAYDAVDDTDDVHDMELHKKPWHRGVRAPEQVGPDVRRQFKASSSAVRGEDVTVFMVSHTLCTLYTQHHTQYTSL